MLFLLVQTSSKSCSCLGTNGKNMVKIAKQNAPLEKAAIRKHSVQMKRKTVAGHNPHPWV